MRGSLSRFARIPTPGGTRFAGRHCLLHSLIADLQRQYRDRFSQVTPPCSSRAATRSRGSSRRRRRRSSFDLRNGEAALRRLAWWNARAHHPKCVHVERTNWASRQQRIERFQVYGKHVGLSGISNTQGIT